MGRQAGNASINITKRGTGSLNILHVTRFEVLAAVLVKIQVFCLVMSVAI